MSKHYVGRAWNLDKDISTRMSHPWQGGNYVAAVPSFYLSILLTDPATRPLQSPSKKKGVLQCGRLFCWFSSERSSGC